MARESLQPENYGIRPTLAELIALRARVLAWPPPQRGSAPQDGPALSPLRGRGMDYAESRLYAQGDETRAASTARVPRVPVVHIQGFSCRT